MTQPALGTDKVMQVGIVVADVEETARAWSQILGLPMPEITMTDEFESSQMEYKGEPSTARARLAFLHMGQVDIELVEPVGEPSTWSDQLRQHGPSIHHIALHIDGMREKLAYLDSQGLKLLQGAEFEGGRYANLDSQEELGAILELLEF